MQTWWFFSAAPGKGGYYFCFEPWHRGDNLFLTACLKSVTLRERSVSWGSESAGNSS